MNIGMENVEKPYHLQIMSKAAPKRFEFEEKKGSNSR